MIIKTHQYSYTIFPNEIVRRKDMSMKSKGILLFLLSMHPDWECSIKGIVECSKEGYDSIKAGVDELVDKGYMRMSLPRDQNGQIRGADWEVADHPLFLEGKPDSGKPGPGKPRSNYNNDSLNKEYLLFPEFEKFDLEKAVVFRNTPLFDFDIFLKAWGQPKGLENVDLGYYHGAVGDWSEKNPKIKRTVAGWMATFRTFMRGDQKNSKLRTNINPSEDPNKSEYLNL